MPNRALGRIAAVKRSAEFWQAILLLEMSPKKARETLDLLEGAETKEDLIRSPALTAQQRTTLNEWAYKSVGERMVSLVDDDYPENLRHARTPPVALSVHVATPLASVVAPGCVIVFPVPVAVSTNATPSIGLPN